MSGVSEADRGPATSSDVVLLDRKFRESHAVLTELGLRVRSFKTNKAPIDTFIANSEIIACEVTRKTELLVHAYVLNLTSKTLTSALQCEKVIVGLPFEGPEAASEAKTWREAIVKGSSGSQQNFLVLINPNSGAYRAERVFRDSVEPLFRLAGIRYDVKVTERAHHAHDFVRDCDDVVLREYTGVIVCGGDGLLFEVINGLAERQDFRELLSTLTFGAIPCGSGNGLVASIHNRNLDPLLSASLSVVRQKVSPMDLVRVETPDRTLHSFLSVTWGFMADVDIRSEVLKPWVGSARFTIWALKDLLFLRTYPARISYLPLDSPVSSLALSATITDDWITMEDSFVTVTAAYQTHLSPDLHIAPDARLNDGIIWLLLVRGSVSRWKLFRFLLRLEKGTHMPDEKDPDIQMVQCQAYRVVPLSEDGIVAVDGEEIEYRPFQAHIIPSIARVFVPADDVVAMREEK